SRVDTAADTTLDEKIAQGTSELKELKGTVAIANARMAYKRFQELFGSDELKELERRGARVQRPLWACTGTKHPDYGDVLYVVTLLGPHTINTMPLKTMDAFLDHGTVERTVDANVDEAERVVARLEAAGISLDAITSKLEDDGITAFADSYDELL